MAKRRGRKYGNDWLRASFLRYNRMYFGNKLPRKMTVKWEHEEDGLAGRFVYPRHVPASFFREVGVQGLSRFFECLAKPPYIGIEKVDIQSIGDKIVLLTLLHECVHAYLHLVEGRDEREVHGASFQKLMLKLAKKGAFRDLW